jgi:hypothetical protein
MAPMNPRLLRPSGRFTPRNIAGLSLWLNAQDAVVSSGEVTSWPDRSGRGFTALPRPSNAPTYGATAINNRPAVKFNGSSQAMLIDANVFSFGLDGTVSMFAAVRPTGAVGTALFSRRYLNLGGETQNRFSPLLSLREFNSSQNWTATATRAGISETNATSSTAVSTVRKIHGLTYDGSTLTHYLNNVSVATASNVPTTLTASTTSGLGSVAIGATVFNNVYEYFTLIDIAEIVIYSRVLSSTERAALHTYFSALYNPE